MENEKYLTVSAITKYIKYKLDSDDNLRTVFMRGEISNFKAHTTGHLYFSVKDETSKINAIMFSTQAKRLTFIPTEGTKVLIVGRISVYEATGNYQIYVEDMQEDGLGNLYIAFEKLKQKLSQEGLFDENHKKPIPKYPKKIGIITASTGAAIKDILSTIKRRYPICETYLFPSLVQGDNASKDIVKKINQANLFDLDILIVGRGGGSIEDLWPFNEEIVAQAIYNSKIPIISAVGHEVDYTIADFVADLRAPTPTGAAELAVPNILEVEKNLQQYTIRLYESIHKKINYQKLYLDSIKNSYVIKSPMIMYENKLQKLSVMREQIGQLFFAFIKEKRQNFNTLIHHYLLENPKEIYKPKINVFENILEKLELVSPLNVLQRGYSLTRQNDKVITNAKDINLRENITIQFSKGKIIAEVKEIKEK